ncbi:hypothetical protein CVT25_004632 [Psilocybe cyanescens]|uniref:Uncharacterized protein n=1 Tax=Psilocybe cyanescens TaxID=93625 RepID=A0A409VSY1_PSICY|nr:hypothetical protein CVT25_004632 [Psilocybe cyanescens]
MVHRPADSRLLTNLLQQEKEYTKQLNQLLDTSNVSLASFGAYAAASPRPASQVIMSVAGSLAAADEALRRYVHGVEEWRDSMRALKDAEDEVGNIMRDREILVTRLIKASKSQKSGSSNFRDSLLLGNQRFPSSSSLSSSYIGQQDSPSPPSSRPLSAAFSSSKLAAAQTELQACETHLAAKERELDTKRNAAIRDGLGARAKAMMECGWAWGQLGKEALHALEELKAENIERRASTYLHEPYLEDTLAINHENTDPHSTRPSFDFSSIGPSQSASQVNVSNEDLPPPVHIGSIMNSGLFGEPNAKYSNNDNAHPNEPQQPHDQAQSSGPRPPSGVSTTASSVSATPATYKVETVTYAPAVAVHVPGREAAGGVGVGTSSSSSSPHHVPASSELFKDDRHLHDSHTSVRIPAPHALEGYAFDIPTATPDRPVAGPSGQQHQQLQRRLSSRSATPSASGRSTPQMTSLAASQPVAAYPKRHVLERRITEEEMRRSSEEPQRAMGGVDDDHDGGSSTEEELEEGKKMIQEGKLEVVENPRFLSEARRKELEKEKEERERAARVEEERAWVRASEKAKEKAKDEEDGAEDGKSKENEKKRFPFFHSSSHSQSARSAQAQAADKQQGNGRVTFAPESPQDDADGHGQRLPKSASASPSKGFLGSIKGLFGGSKQAKDGPSSPLRSRQKREGLLPASPSHVANEPDDVSDSDDDDARSPTTRSSGGGGGLQALFRGSKDKDKGSASKWETRTDRNIQQLARKGSFDDGSVGRRGLGISSGLGGGLAGRVVANAGVVNASEVGVGRAPGPGPGSGVGQRGRVFSDVGFGGSAGAAVGPAGRKLKKNRTGPPVAPSASGVAMAGDDRASVGSVESVSRVGVGAAARPAASGVKPVVGGQAPVRAASTSVPANRAKGKGVGVGSRRSASVDVNPERRKSWDEDEEEEEDRTGGGGGMIVDLGWRRRTTSEVGGPRAARTPAAAPTPAPAAPAVRQAVQPVKPFHGVLRTTPTRDYSSDTAAIVTAPVVTGTKSLTKKKQQATAAAAVPSVPPPVPVVSSSVPLAPPVRDDPVSTPAPTRKSSMKASGTPTATPTAAKVSPGGGGATIMPAGGDHPSGTLVSQPGWGAQAQALSGGLSRNSSFTSSASAPSGPGGGASRGKRQTSLGQGMGGSGLGRRSSLGSSSQALAHSGKADASAYGSPANANANANGSVVQATPAVPSLMSIVEDVARTNREGWNHDLKLQKSVGGTQKATGLIEVVKAPPPVGREELNAMDAAQIKTRAAGGYHPSMTMASASASTLTLTGPSGAKAAPKTSMFEIKAPGSVFDQRARAVGMSREASASAPSLVTGSAHRPVQTSTPKQDRAQARVSVSGPGGNANRMLGPAKTPLRSAMRTSRSPSPVVAGTVPPPMQGTLPWDSDGAVKKDSKAVKDKGKGKAPVRPTGGNPDDSGDTDDDSESYETGNEFYSDQEEVEKIVVVAASTSVARLKATAANGGVVPPTAAVVPNGQHPTEYGSPKAASDASYSTASTVLGGSSLHTPSSQPRRRKSVRVSLQPTFSPSPPAIEYESEEEQQRRYAPWATATSSSSQGHASEGGTEHEEKKRRYSQPAPLPAPVPVRAAAAPAPVIGVGVGRRQAEEAVYDMWQDSGSDEDEQYVRAKKLLTRAAKREKDVNLLVANRA